jgi:mono/diheme cytochrome c family protein
MRAIREGIDHQGRPLIVMPSQALHQLSDADASALIVYMRSQPAVNHDLPQRNLTVLAALFIGGGMFPTSAQTPILEPVIAPEIGSLEYGAYLISSLGCTDCHGLDLAGKPAGAGPGGPNLTVIVPNWKEEDFIALFREGRDPTGRQVSQTAMPWKSYSQALSDEELNNTYRYLISLQRIEETNR